MTDETDEPGPSRAEFERVVLPHLEAMARLARFLLAGNPPDAEDLVQDAVLRAYTSFPRFEPGTNLRAWLFRILRNTWVDLLRKRGRQGELADVEADTEDAALEEFRAAAVRARREADLEAALARLPGEFRLVLLLVDGEEMRYDEVAAVLECPVGTVRSRVHRGRRLLRQHLLELWRRPASP